MIKTYRYIIAGSGGNGQTFSATGQIDCEFHETFDTAMQASFKEITQGRAVYGKPGIGCTGPYDIHKVVIERVKH